MQTAKELAAALGLKSTDAIYRDAEAYGALRRGTGPRARLLFPNTEQALANMQEYRANNMGHHQLITRERPGRKRKPPDESEADLTPNGNPLLPLP